jgi:hypothetical protein
MAQKGLKVEPVGILAVLKYLWGIPIVRTAASWVLEKSITYAIKKVEEGRPGRVADRLARQEKIRLARLAGQPPKVKKSQLIR